MAPIRNEQLAGDPSADGNSFTLTHTLLRNASEQALLEPALLRRVTVMPVPALECPS